MLADDMVREAVRIGFRGAFSVGQEVDFAVRLLEGLHDGECCQPAAPCRHFRDIAVDRMPKRDTGLLQAHGRTTDIAERAVVPDVRRAHIADVCVPDQATAQRAEHRG